MKNLYLPILIVLMNVFSSFHANAQLLWSESFTSYTEGQNIHGINGWDYQSSNTGYRARNATPLSYPNLSTTMGYFVGGYSYQSVGINLPTAASPLFTAYASSVGGNLGYNSSRSNNTMWMSFLVRADDNNNDFKFGLSDNIAWYTDNDTIQVNNSSGIWRLSVDKGTTFTTTGVACTIGQTYLLVMKLTFGATSTIVDLYVNPTIDINNTIPSSPSASGTKPAKSYFKGISYRLGIDLNKYSVDEVRIGVNYADVTPRIVPITSLSIASAGNVTSIPSGQTLQFSVQPLPIGASEGATWSVVPGTGTATINGNGLLTAGTTGTVTVKAVSTDNVLIQNTFALTINPPVLVSSITLSSAGNVTSMSAGTTLQFSATILPINANNKNVTWSVIAGTGTASIDSNGLLTALTAGTITVNAVAQDGSAVQSTFTLTITPPVPGIGNLATTGVGTAWDDIPSATSTSDASRKTLAGLNDGNISVDNAYSDASATGNWQAAGIVWSNIQPLVSTLNFYNGVCVQLTDNGVFTSSVKLQSSTDGTTWADVAGWSCSPAYLYGSTAPSNQIYNFSGPALSNIKGIRVIGKVRENDSRSIKVKEVEVFSSIVNVTSIAIQSAGNATSLYVGNTLQLSADVLPANAPNKNVTWSVIAGTGTASIDSNGLLTALTAGTITVKAVAQDGSLVQQTKALMVESLPMFTSRGQNLPNEGLDKLFDGDLNSKWLDNSPTSWVRVQYSIPKVWNTYAITSGNDAPGRDPKNWTLQGSNNGTTWTVLDTRTSQSWAVRNQTQTFYFANSTAYTYYKWDITLNNGDNVIQASELAFSLIEILDNNWTGTTSTNWHTATNWSKGIVPTILDNVVIPNVTRKPIIGLASECNNITIDASSSLTITGTNTLTVKGNWIKNGTFTPNTSTVIFNGSAQSLTGNTVFYNLTLSGGGIKTLNANIGTIGGNFILSGTASTTALKAMTIGGDVILGNGTSFTHGAFTHNVAGNWTNNGGTYTSTGGTVNFTGSEKSINGTALTQTFNILFIRGNITVGTDLVINGNVTITDGKTLFGTNKTITIKGNWDIPSNYGFFDSGTSTVIFDKAGVQSIKWTQFYNLTCSGSGVKNITDACTVNNNFTISGTAIPTLGSGSDVNFKNVIINSGATLNATDKRINVSGNWTNNGGNYNYTSAQVTFVGDNASINGTAAIQSFYGFKINKTTGQTLSVGGSTTRVNVNSAFELVNGNFIAPAAMYVENSSLTLTAGVFTAGANLYVQSWINNGGTFLGGTGTVWFTQQYYLQISGSAETTFNNLTLFHPDAKELTSNITVNGTLTLKADLWLNNRILSFGPTALPVVIATTGKSIKMTNGGGSIRKLFTTNGSFLFPITDLGGKYSPITLNFTTGTYAPGAYAQVSVIDGKHSNNTSSANYLTRYWPLSQTGISDFSCNISATYQTDDDIIGLESAIVAGLYIGGTPAWDRYGTSCVSNQLVANGVTALGDYTGVVRNFWKSTGSTAWSEPTNWAFGVLPTSTEDVIVATTSNYGSAASADLIADGDYSIGSFTNTTTSRLVIPPAKSLTVKNTITTDNDPSRIYIQSNSSDPNGSLVFHNAVQSPVYATVEMYSMANGSFTAPTVYRWQYFGIPFRSIIANPTFYGAFVRQHNEAGKGSGLTPDKRWIQLSNNSVLSSFNGYEIVQENAKTYVLQGILENSNFSRQLSYTPVTPSVGQVPGEHILSNPYTAAMDIKQMSFGADLQETVYLYNTGSYADWAANSGSGNSPGQYLSVPKNVAGDPGIPATVPSMQGFMVRTLPSVPVPTQTTFSINYGTSVIKNTERQRVKSKMDNNEKVITIVDVKGNRYADKLWIYTNPNCTRAFDNGWDGMKMIVNTNAPQLYASETDGNYQINTVDDIDNSELTFAPGEDDYYTLKFTHYNTESRYSNLYLLDKQENTLVDITQSGIEYSFSSAPKAPSTNRFKIVTQGGITTDFKVNNLTSNEVKIFSYNGTIFMQNLTDKNGEVMLYDISGRLVLKKVFSALAVSTIKTNVMEGTYIVKASLGNTIITNSIIIKK